MKKQLGFSLLEIMIVITLSAGFMAFTVPNLFRGIESDLPRTLRQVSAYVKNLQFLSITNNQPLQLIFDFDKNSCYVLIYENNGWIQDNETFEPLELPSGVSFRYFKNNEQLITTKIARINILPFGYIDQFKISLEKSNKKMYFQTTTILGESTIAYDESLFF